VPAPETPTAPPRTLTAKLGEVLSPALDALVRALAHVSADVLTMTGLALTGIASAFFALAGGPGYVSPTALRVGGVIALAGLVATLGSLAAGLLYDRTGSYTPTFALGVALTLIALAVLGRLARLGAHAPRLAPVA